MVPFRDICSRITYQNPNCKFLSSTLGRWVEDYAIDADYLCQHARQMVDFRGALCDAKAKDIIQDDSIFLEIGPNPVCNGFVKSILGSSAITCASLRRQKASWDNLASAASQLSNKGAKVDWAEYHREFESSMQLLELPSYGWALSNYWIDYQNDWCLTKGTGTASRQRLINSSFAGTTSVHRVVKEDFTHSEKFVKAETDLSEPNIRSLLKGHMVNNVALCPSSLYGDIGITIGTYMYKKMNTNSESGTIPGMNVRDMSVHKTLILHDVASHIISIDAKSSDSKSSIQISISSQQGEHASFVVEFCTQSDWVDEWSRTGFLVESRMESLREYDNGKSVYMLPQEVAYKIFSAFVNYSKPFQGMKKVYLDSVHWEATADVVLEASNPDQSFAVSPYWIDSIGHLSGFILNAQLCDHDPKNVYVSHGWESLRIAKVLVPGKTYRTYVRMMERPGGNLVSGDIYCIEDSSVIAVFGGVTFMRLPRSVLDQVLPRPQSLTSRTQRIPVSGVTHVDKIAKIAAPKLDNTKKTPYTSSILGRVLTIIAEECGVDQSELVDVISFADLGVDSLLQLAICSRLREELCLEIPSSLFVDNPMVGSLKSFIQPLAHSEDSEDTESAVSSTAASHCQHSPSSIVSVTDDTDIFTNDTEYWDNNDTQNQGHKENLSKDLFPERALANVSHSSSLPPAISNKHATSFLLQGNPRLATKKLFLFPDGGGSATSYTQIQDLSPEIAVYGLNSPFMTTPEEYTCGVSGIAKYFIQEIKRRQDKGPYNIGVSISLSLCRLSAGAINWICQANKIYTGMVRWRCHSF